jgi:hypothetical protein
MKPSSEHDDRLLKLLALKRHERPPPGYFEHFSSGIIARLNAGEGKQCGWWDDIFEEALWLKRLWSAFEAKPVLAGTFGVVVCGLVVSGILYSQKLDQASATSSPPVGQSLLTGTPSGWALEPYAQAPLTASTNPVLEPQIPGSVFDMFRPVAKPASYNFNP